MKCVVTAPTEEEEEEVLEEEGEEEEAEVEEDDEKRSRICCGSILMQVGSEVFAETSNVASTYSVDAFCCCASLVRQNLKLEHIVFDGYGSWIYQRIFHST